MVKRIALSRIICFCPLAAGAASCQSEPALGEGLRGLQFRGTDRQRQERGAGRLSPAAPLPDAPLPSAPAPGLTRFQTDSFRGTGGQPRLPFSVGAVDPSGFRETQAAYVAALFSSNAGSQFFLNAPDKLPAQKSSRFFLDKYLNPTTLPRGSRYQASSRDDFMGRATDAASRIFLTRDLSGARRLNTSYFLRVATSIVADTASRPYWRRSASAPFSDFGSTVGNDAGMNLLHEFGPSLQHAVTSHVPKFVWRMEEGILQNLNQPKPHISNR